MRVRREAEHLSMQHPKQTRIHSRKEGGTPATQHYRQEAHFAPMSSFFTVASGLSGAIAVGLGD
jgi:hypothetical protein